MPASAPSSQAGPSRSSRPSNARTTRRQTHEQSELLTQVARPVIDSGYKVSHAQVTPRSLTNVRRSTSDGPLEPLVLVKGKGRARALEDDLPVEQVSSGLRIHLSKKTRLRTSDENDMPPPPLPKGVNGRLTRRATMEPATPVAVSEPLLEKIEASGRRRGRISLPSLPIAKASKLPGNVDYDKLSSSQAAATSPEQPDPAPVVLRLPSLAYAPFPPPPARPRHRVHGPSRVWYTDPLQLPPNDTQYVGDIARVMTLQTQMDDTGPLPDPRVLQLQAARDAYTRNRVNYLQQQGRLLRLLEDHVDEAKPTGHRKRVTLPPRQTDHQDSMMSHMVQVRNAIINEAKLKPQTSRRISKMVQNYWDHIEGKEDRERAAEEKVRRLKARDLARALKKRWGLAVKVCRIVGSLRHG